MPIYNINGVTEDIVIRPFDKKSVRICKGPKSPYVITRTRLQIKKIGQPSDISEIVNQELKKTIKIQIQ